MADIAQIINNENNEPLDLANAAGTPYAAEDAVVKPQAAEAQVIDSDLALANNKQLLGVNAAGEQKALAALRTYRDGDDNVTAEQVEIGSEAVHTNFNSIDRPTVEMQGHQDKELLAFLSDLPPAPTYPTHEINVLDLATLDITGLSGTLSWIIVHLSSVVSDISIWGEITTEDTIATGEHVILTPTDEPLLERFVGTVGKVALNLYENDLSMQAYKFDENGLTLNVNEAIEKTVTFQDRLFLVAENLSDAESRV